MIQEKDSKPGDKETLGLPAYTPMQQVNYSAPTLSYCLFILFIVVLEKTLESPLDCKEIQPVNPKGNQPWISIGRTDAAAEAPILWPPDAKSWLSGKDPDIGKDGRQKEKRVAEDKILDSITNSMDMNLGKLQEIVKDSLVCCSPRGRKELDVS